MACRSAHPSIELFVRPVDVLGFASKMVPVVRLSLFCWLLVALLFGVALGGPGGLTGAVREGNLVFDRGHQHWRSDTLLTPWNPFEEQPGERADTTAS